MSRFDKFMDKANTVVFTAIQLGFYIMAVYVGMIILKTIASFIW